MQKEKEARAQRRRGWRAGVGARWPRDSEGAVKRVDKSTKQRFETTLSRCFSFKVLDNHGWDCPVTEHSPLLGGANVFKLTVAHGEVSW